MLTHNHKCTWCSTEYHHTHPARNSDHKQLEKQCPNPECQQYQGADTSGLKVVSTLGAKPDLNPKSTKSTADKPAGTPLERDVARRYQDGRLKCNIVAHYKYVHSEGDKYPHTEGRHWRDILERMQPYTPYTCCCEKAALAEAAQHNYTGIPQTEFVSFGGTMKGVGEYNPKFPAKRVCPVGYRVTKEKGDYLHNLFPDWLFVTVSSGGHDHAVAHTVTKIHGYEMLELLPKGTAESPRRYLDLYGSPGPNANYNARTPHTHVDTNVFAWSAKDEIRAAEKWGAEFEVVNGVRQRRYYEADLRSLQGLDNVECPNINTYDAVFSVHSIYYFDPNSIAGIVKSMGRRKTLECVVHRFDGPTEGTINAGEQAWRKHNQGGDMYVTQTNLDTGEEYSHFDNSWMFEGNYWMTGTEEAGSNANTYMYWTTNKMSDDTYRVKFVLITAAMFTAAMGRGAKVPVGPVGLGFAARPKKKTKKAQIAKEQQATVNLGGQDFVFEVRPEAQKAFDNLRTKIALKPRTPKTFRDHVAKAQREVLASKGAMGADDLHDLVLGSFWIDYEQELCRMDGAALAIYQASIVSDMRAMGGDLGAYRSTFDHLLHFIETALSAKTIKGGAVQSVGLLRTLMARGTK